MQRLKEFDGKGLVSMAKEQQELPEENKVEFENVCTLTEAVLDKKVEEMVVSDRLCLHPAVLMSTFRS